MSNGIQINMTLDFANIEAYMDQNWEKAMLKAAMRVHKEVTYVLSGNRSGKLYKVPGTKAKYYKASRPGEPPASRLGHLRTSYKYLVKGKGMDAIGYVGSPLEYSHYLEYGTYKMAPRPHLKTAFQNADSDVKKIFEGFYQ